MLSENNSLSRMAPVTDPTSLLDAIGGLAATDVRAKGYLQAGPHGTLLVFDFLAAQTLVQLIGFENASSEPVPADVVQVPQPEPWLGVDLTATGGKDAPAGLPPPSVQHVPEPATAALLGIGLAVIASTRRRRKRR